MAWLAEMSITPTEPLRNRTAEFAFVFYEFHSMRLAILHATTYADSGALTTNKLFFFEILIIILGSLTVFHTSEVRVIALEALVIG